MDLPLECCECDYVLFQYYHMQSMVQHQQNAYPYMNAPPVVYNNPPPNTTNMVQDCGAAAPDISPLGGMASDMASITTTLAPEEEFPSQLGKAPLTAQCKSTNRNKHEVVSLKKLQHATSRADKSNNNKSTWKVVKDSDSEQDESVNKICDSLSAISTNDSGCISDVSSAVSDDAGRNDTVDHMNDSVDSVNDSVDHANDKVDHVNASVDKSTMQSSLALSGNGNCKVIDVKSTRAVNNQICPMNKSTTKSISSVNNRVCVIPGLPPTVHTTMSTSLAEVRPFKMTPTRQYHQATIVSTNRGTTRVVRPIKEIPPRFMKMLTPRHKSTRPHQFEGQPLLHNNSHKKYPCDPELTSGDGNGTYSFNPNAQSFVPGQIYDDPLTYDPMVAYDLGSEGSDSSIDMSLSSNSPTYTIVMNSTTPPHLNHPPTHSTVYQSDSMMCFNSSTGYYQSPGSASSGASGQVFYPPQSYAPPSYMPCGPQSGGGPTNSQQHQVVYNGMQNYTVTSPNLPTHNSQYNSYN